MIKKMIKPLIIIFFFGISAYLNFFYLPVQQVMAAAEKKKNDTVVVHDKNTFLMNDLSHLRDTLFTHKSSFIIVNLKSQTAQLFHRDSAVFDFKISSGNERLFKGQKTKEGLFTIKSKMPKWHSRQFDMTLMLNWMGFNYGIGFHALATSSYYNYLGKKPSSHGCLRISREDAKKIYDLVEIGTPVMVHNGEYSLWIGFTRDDQKYISYPAKVLPEILNYRSEALYSGDYFLLVHDAILIGDDIPHKGLPVGGGKTVPRSQKIVDVEFRIIPTIIDMTYINNTVSRYFDTTNVEKNKLDDETLGEKE